MATCKQVFTLSAAEEKCIDWDNLVWSVVPWEGGGGEGASNVVTVTSSNEGSVGVSASTTYTGTGTTLSVKCSWASAVSGQTSIQIKQDGLVILWIVNSTGTYPYPDGITVYNGTQISDTEFEATLAAGIGTSILIQCIATSEVFGSAAGTYTMEC